MPAERAEDCDKRKKIEGDIEMVYVQTTHDVSCTIEGSRILAGGDEYIVVNDNGDITGVFDIGAIQFMYLTHSKKKEAKDNDI